MLERISDYFDGGGDSWALVKLRWESNSTNKKASQLKSRGELRCFHNGIILIVICFLFVWQDYNIFSI